jgi:hypothetical protein
VGLIGIRVAAVIRKGSEEAAARLLQPGIATTIIEKIKTNKMR